MTETQKIVLGALADQAEPVTVEELRMILAGRGRHMRATGVHRQLVRLRELGYAEPELVWRTNPARPRAVRQINAWRRVQP